MLIVSCVVFVPSLWSYVSKNLVDPQPMQLLKPSHIRRRSEGYASNFGGCCMRTSIITRREIPMAMLIAMDDPKSWGERN